MPLLVLMIEAVVLALGIVMPLLLPGAILTILVLVPANVAWRHHQQHALRPH